MMKAEGLVTQLPYDVLFDSFQMGFEPDQDDAKGISWTSHETITPLTLICRAWYEAAQDSLYTSVTLLSAASTELFLRTATSNPRWMDRVRYLVVGLGDEEATGDAAAQLSVKLVHIINLCSNLRHLQIRPLHESVRVICMSAILSKRLVSLVCSPRLVRPDIPWTTILCSKEEIHGVASTPIRALELDVGTNPSQLAVELAPPPQRCPVVNLRLHFVIPDAQLFALLTASAPTLEVVDLYFEHLLPLEQTVAALKLSCRTMRNLRYVSNPTINELRLLTPTTTPLFDQLLPQFKQLEQLSVSATDISILAFKSLPLSLKMLDIVSYNHQAAFKALEGLVDILHDQSIVFRAGLVFSMSDSIENWPSEFVERVRKAAFARGIIFVFTPDSDDIM